MSRVWICDLAHKAQQFEARLIQVELSWSNDSTFIWVHFCEMMALCAPTWHWPMMMAMMMTIVALPLLWSFSNAGYRVGGPVGLWVSHNEKIEGMAFSALLANHLWTPTVQSGYSIFLFTTLSLVAFLSLRVFRRDWVSDDTSIWIFVACLSLLK